MVRCGAMIRSVYLKPSRPNITGFPKMWCVLLITEVVICKAHSHWVFYGLVCSPWHRGVVVYEVLDGAYNFSLV